MKLHHLYETFDEAPEDDVSQMDNLEQLEYYLIKQEMNRSLSRHTLDRIKRSQEFKNKEIFRLDDYKSLAAQEHTKYVGKTTEAVFTLGGYQLMGLRSNPKVVKWLDTLQRAKDGFRHYQTLCTKIHNKMGVDPEADVDDEHD